MQQLHRQVHLLDNEHQRKVLRLQSMTPISLLARQISYQSTYRVQARL